MTYANDQMAPQDAGAQGPRRRDRLPRTPTGAGFKSGAYDNYDHHPPRDA